VSTPQPPRRRRIAGESKPAAPAPAKKPTARKKPAKAAQAPAPKPAAPAKPPTPVARPARSKPKPPVEAEVQPAAAPVAPGPDDPSRRPSPALVALLVVTVAALAFGAFFGVRGWQDWQDSHGIVDAHEKAASTASSAAETIFSYEYDKLDDHMDDAKATMTKAFAKKFESIAPALNDLAPQRKIQVKASTRDAAAVDCGTSCDADRADVLVFVDQARLADGSKEPTVFANRITMSMVRQNGSWLVDDIEAL
jgi:hypothetical protein